MTKTRSEVTKAAEFKGSPLALAVMAALAMHAPAQAENFPAEISASELNGDSGFIISGYGYDFLGGATSVSEVNDFNGDGVTDIAIGMGDANIAIGQGYIVFGGDDIGSSGMLDLSTDITGENGFGFGGGNGSGTDALAAEISDAGDFNGDGFSDVILTSGYDYDDTAFIVFGGSNVGASGTLTAAELQDGTSAFAIDVGRVYTGLGFSVSSAGDINGDGFSDVVLGNPTGLTEIRDGYGTYIGESYVVFGSANVRDLGSIDIASLDGTNGFVINGIDEFDRSGSIVSDAGDFNDDGVSDLIITAPGATSVGGDTTGESYVVFGGEEIGSSGVLNLSSLDGTNGFVINGVGANLYSNFAASAAGDINADGVSDLIIGADLIDLEGGDDAGQAYVVFGGSGVGNDGALDLAELDGTNGFTIDGIGAGDRLGEAVSAGGDINGDGVSDFIIVAETYGSSFGDFYVVFGGEDVGNGGEIELDSLNGTNGFLINADVFEDTPYTTLSTSAGDINGDGLSDIIGTGYAFDNGTRTVGFVVFGRQTPISSGAPAPILTCNGLPVTVNLALGQSPTSGNDVILGTEGADIIRALGGNDTICGLGGNDVINAGGGDDWVDAGAGNDRVFGIGGADVLRGRSGADRIFGGGGDDLINGDGGADKLDGGLGDDLVFGGGGGDEVSGRAGSDSLFGGGGNDSILGGAGADDINGGAGADVLNGGSGTDNCVVDSADSVSSCD